MFFVPWPLLAVSAGSNGISESICRGVLSNLDVQERRSVQVRVCLEEATADGVDLEGSLTNRAHPLFLTGIAGIQTAIAGFASKRDHRAAPASPGPAKGTDHNRRPPPPRRPTRGSPQRPNRDHSQAPGTADRLLIDPPTIRAPSPVRFRVGRREVRWGPSRSSEVTHVRTCRPAVVERPH